jgi:hypothetical protein
MKVTPAIEASGYGITGDIGGLSKTTYWTPDGRMILSVPSIREYQVKKDGKVIRQGTRDANLDRGWLLQKPQILKPHCNGCGNWHDTQSEVDACIIKQKEYLDRMERLAHKEAEKTSLEKQVADLQEMVKKLLEGKK